MTVTNTLVNGNTADAGELNTNFSDVISATSDGTKDFNINALTCAGAVAFNGNMTLGNATSDTVTFTARVASDILPSADSTYDLGSSSLAFAEVHTDLIVANAATALVAGLVDTNAQSFDGLKTFEAGIKPSSGSDALTHYEEGTWSGSITGSTGGSSGPNTGYYIKIGKLVTATIEFNNFNFAGGTGTISIINLPFDAGSGKYYGSMWSLSLDSDLTPDLVPVIESGNNFIYFYKQGSGSPAAWSSAGAGNYVRMTITYISE